MDKMILVYYVGYGNIPAHDVAEYLDRFRNLVELDDDNIIQMFIPVRGETRVECINPKFVVEEEMNKKFERLMKTAISKGEEIMSLFPYAYRRRVLTERI